jgi:hypothetical protein
MWKQAELTMIIQSQRTEVATHRPRRVGRRLVLLAVSGLFATVPVGIAARADSSATLSGRVMAAGIPLGGTRVSLVAMPSSGSQVTSTKTDAKGNFSFPGLTAGSAITYTATTVYQHATFTSDGVNLTVGEVHDTTLNVYPTTVSPAAVTLTSWTVWLDFTGGKIAVQQDVEYKNAGSGAYVGTVVVDVATGSGTGAVVLPVATGAGNFEYLGRFQACCSAASSGVWAHIRPIAPGNSNGTMRYEAPLTGHLSFPAQFPATAFAILVPAGIHISSPQLQPAGNETDRGVTYQVFRGGPLAAGAVISITVGAPPRTIGPTAWGAGLVVLLVIGMIVWFGYRRRNRNRPVLRPPSGSASPESSQPEVNSAAAKLADAPVMSSAAAKSVHGRAKPKTNERSHGKRSAPPMALALASNGASELHGDPAELADELARLDLAFENGSLDNEPTYRMIREALVQRLVAAVATDPNALR